MRTLGDPQSSSGEGASQWGIWRLDPGPRGIQLEEYELVKGNLLMGIVNCSCAARSVV
jgi:uncharacterized cupin superfamily protein